VVSGEHLGIGPAAGICAIAAGRLPLPKRSPMFAWIESRLKEPSTYAGIAGVIGTMTFLPHYTDIASAIPVVGAAIASLMAIVLTEKSK